MMGTTTQQAQDMYVRPHQFTKDLAICEHT